MDELIVEDRPEYGLVAIMGYRATDPARIGAALEIAMPAASSRTCNNHGLSLIGTGPGGWLACTDNASPFLADELRDRLSGLASVSDQSSGYEIIRLAGAGARTLLQRGIAIDLHPDMFGPDAVAVTAIAHIAVIVWRVDDGQAYDVAIPRSYVPAFRDWLDHAAAAH